MTGRSHRARSAAPLTRPLRVGVVVLTTGERPTELAAALDSVRRQRDVDPRIVVVHNVEIPDAPGVLEGDGLAADVDLPDEAAEPDDPEPDDLDLGLGAAEGTDVTVLRPGSNLGIPEGRNLGVDALDDVEVVLFLDDDGVLVGGDVLARATAAFAADPTLGAISMRIVDPDTGRTERRHVPRLRVGDPSRSSWVTTFLGGASLVRRVAYQQAGGLPGRFFYAHEETSLAWRLLDAGYRIRYAGDLQLAHPAVAPARHAAYHHLTGRNRVLLARQHLPAPLAVVYVLLWAVIGAVRSPGGRRALLAGFIDGLRVREVDRTPIRWRTAWRMLRYGRPPLL